LRLNNIFIIRFYAVIKKQALNGPAFPTIANKT